MRKLAVWMQMSLDGFSATPDGTFNWPSVSHELTDYWLQLSQQFDLMLYGRKVFEMMVSYWPTADEPPNAGEYAKAYSPIWRETPKIVFSKTLTGAQWNTTVVSDRIMETLTDLKERPGKDMAVFGGPSIVSTLVQAGLVDEYRLFVHPVALRGGFSPFGIGPDRLKLRLQNIRQFSNGVVAVHYSRAA